MRCTCTLLRISYCVANLVSRVRCIKCRLCIAKTMFELGSSGQRWKPRERSIISTEQQTVYVKYVKRAHRTHNRLMETFVLDAKCWMDGARKWLTFYFERCQRWHCNRCGTSHKERRRSALKPLLCTRLWWRWTLLLLRRTSHDGRRLIRVDRQNDEMCWTRWRNAKWIPIDRSRFGWIHFHLILKPRSPLSLIRSHSGSFFVSFRVVSLFFFFWFRFRFLFNCKQRKLVKFLISQKWRSTRKNIRNNNNNGWRWLPLNARKLNWSNVHVNHRCLFRGN